MSQVKYSPALSFVDANRPYSAYCYNADGQIPPEWTIEMKESGEIYDPRLHCDMYDENGRDCYGYSAFDANGNYVGGGMGVDAWGYTEMDYLGMSSDFFEAVCATGGAW